MNYKNKKKKIESSTSRTVKPSCWIARLQLRICNRYVFIVMALYKQRKKIIEVNIEKLYASVVENYFNQIKQERVRLLRKLSAKVKNTQIHYEQSKMNNTSAQNHTFCYDLPIAVGAAQLITIHRVQGELTMAVLISICDEGCRRAVASRWPVRLQLHARMECSLWIGSLLVKKYAGNLLADSRCCGRFFRDWQKHNDGVCFPVLFEIHLIHFFATSLLMIRQISLEPYLKHSFPNKPQTYNHVGRRYGRGQKENDR